MTSQGSPHGRFLRSLATGNPTLAFAAAAELPQVTLSDALALCGLLAESGDRRYPRASARWLARLEANGATLAELQLAAGALARLQEDPDSELAMEVLERLAD